jgi:hypothetical protein
MIASATTSSRMPRNWATASVRVAKRVDTSRLRTLFVCYILMRYQVRHEVLGETWGRSSLPCPIRFKSSTREYHGGVQLQELVEMLKLQFQTFFGIFWIASWLRGFCAIIYDLRHI